MPSAAAGSATPQIPPSRGGAVAAMAVLAVAGVALLVVVLGYHRVPTFGVETDLIGDLIPAARALRAGHATAANVEFKGPGYPLMLAAAGALLGGNDWAAARLLDVLAAIVGAWFAYRIALRFFGEAAALFVVVALFANPIWLRAAVEAGTDMPAFA